MNDICENKHGGNSESQMAFNSLFAALPRQRQLALIYITMRGSYGTTSQEYADSMGVPINKISGRFSELKKAELIEKIGVRNGGGVFVVKNEKEISNHENN